MSPGPVRSAQMRRGDRDRGTHSAVPDGNPTGDPMSCCCKTFSIMGRSINGFEWRATWCSSRKMPGGLGRRLHEPQEVDQAGARGGARRAAGAASEDRRRQCTEFSEAGLGRQAGRRRPARTLEHALTASIAAPTTAAGRAEPQRKETPAGQKAGDAPRRCRTAGCPPSAGDRRLRGGQRHRRTEGAKRCAHARWRNATNPTRWRPTSQRQRGSHAPADVQKRAPSRYWPFGRYPSRDRTRGPRAAGEDDRLSPHGSATSAGLHPR